MLLKLPGIKYYPEAFYKVYFKVKSDLNIKDYYCKRQVKTELNRLYDDDNFYNDSKIKRFRINFRDV